MVQNHQFVKPWGPNVTIKNKRDQNHELGKLGNQNYNLVKHICIMTKIFILIF